MLSIQGRDFLVEGHCLMELMRRTWQQYQCQLLELCLNKKLEVSPSSGKLDFGRGSLPRMFLDNLSGSFFEIHKIIICNGDFSKVGYFFKMVSEMYTK